MLVDVFTNSKIVTPIACGCCRGSGPGRVCIGSDSVEKWSGAHTSESSAPVEVEVPLRHRLLLDSRRVGPLGPPQQRHQQWWVGTAGPRERRVATPGSPVARRVATPRQLPLSRGDEPAAVQSSA